MNYIPVNAADATTFDPLLPLLRVCPVLGNLSPSGVRNLIMSGDLPGVRVGKRLMVRTSDLVSYIARDQVAA